MQRAYSSAEVAAVLGVTRTTVTRWAAAGLLPAFDIGVPGRPRLRFTEDAIRTFIDGRRVSAP